MSHRAAASLAVPGGTTPGEFLTALAGQPVDWSHVTVLLTDERWVAPDHPRSNTGLVDRTLGARGLPYRWYALWREGIAADEATATLEADASAVAWPLDFAVLGMGDDGHVASLFPGDETGYADASSRFVAVRGPDGEQRVSLSAAVLARARETYLLDGAMPATAPLPAVTSQSSKKLYCESMVAETGESASNAPGRQLACTWNWSFVPFVCKSRSSHRGSSRS